MFAEETFVKDFIWGMSVLSAYFSYNNKENLQDVNIFAESFVRDLMNILFDKKLCRAVDPRNAGYDLIDIESKIVVQVTSNCRPEKINETLGRLDRSVDKRARLLDEKLKKINEVNKELKELEDKQKNIRMRGEVWKDSVDRSQNEANAKRETIVRIQEEIENLAPDIRGFTVLFLFLKKDADPVKNDKGRGYNNSRYINFSQSNSIYYIDDLVRLVSNLSLNEDCTKIDSLIKFMNKQKTIFCHHNRLFEDKVGTVIREYANHFVAPLFLHQYEKNTEVTLQNTYIEPKFNIVKGSKPDSDSIVSLLDNFVYDNRKVRLLFIDGDAAIGKTSLMSWLCYHYQQEDAAGKSVFLNRRLVIIRLRDITIKGVDSLENCKCIFDYLNIEPEEFEARYSSSIIVLEGADELSSFGFDDGITIEQFISAAEKVFSNHKLVITSRPHFINTERFCSASSPFEFEHVCISHFSSKDREEWIRRYKRHGGAITQSTEEYIKSITDNDADGVADTPLALYLLSACKVSEKLKDNKWSLYYEIFHNAIKNTTYNNTFQGGEHTAFRNQDVAEKVYETVGAIAFSMYKHSYKEQYFVDSKELNSIANEISTEKISAEILKKTCVLYAYWKESESRGILEFYHNNIRDYFLCEYIYKVFSAIDFSDDKDNIAEQLITTGCKVFQHEVFAKKTWAQTFMFFYYRIKAEKENPHSGSLAEIKVADYFPHIIFKLFQGNQLWRYEYSTTSYNTIKATALNFALFIKVWAIALSSDDKVISFTDSDHGSFWREKGVFTDWVDLYTDSIEIANNIHVSLGSNTSFSKMQFNNLSMDTACFERVNMDNSAFFNVDLSHASFGYSKLKKVDFSQSSLCGSRDNPKSAHFCHAELVDVSFIKAKLSGVDFSEATLESVDFSGADIKNTSFIHASISNVTWPNSKNALSSTEFKHTKVSKTKIKKMDLTQTQLNEAEFTNCIFEDVLFPDLVCVTFKNCNLKNCSFKDTTNCCFKGSTLTGDLNWSSHTLKNVEFTNSSIESIVFKFSRLEQVVFNRCSVNEIQLYNANLCANSFMSIRATRAKLMQPNTVHISEV